MSSKDTCSSRDGGSGKTAWKHLTVCLVWPWLAYSWLVVSTVLGYEKELQKGKTVRHFKLMI